MLYKLYLINTIFFTIISLLKLSHLLNLDLYFSAFLFLLFFFSFHELEPGNLAIVFNIRSLSFYQYKVMKFMLYERLTSYPRKEPIHGHA